MTTLREAATQALEALQNCANGYSMKREEAIEALRAALVEPVQEPAHLLHQALQALLMMRDRYSDDDCPACDHADAAIKALRGKR